MTPGSIPAEDLSGDYREWKLPRGPHELPRQVVADHQRQRLLSGAAHALAEHGYARMTVEHVLVQAGVSRATFYENFDNKAECVLIAHDQAFGRLVDEIFHACASQPSWPTKVKAAVGVGVAFATRSPDQTQLLVVEAMAPEPVLVSRVLTSNDFLAELLRSGREECPEAASLPDLMERALIGAVSATIGSEVMSGQADRLLSLEPQLVQFVLMPYLGVEESRLVAEASL